MIDQTLILDVISNTLVIAMPPEEVLQLEAQISVITPDQIALLEGIRSDSESARDLSKQYSIDSLNSANDSEDSEILSRQYMETTKYHKDDTIEIFKQTDQLYQDTDRLHSQTKTLHSQTSDLRNQTQNLHDQTEALHDQTSGLTDDSAESAAASESSRQASDAAADAAKISETSSKTSAAESLVSENNSKASEIAADNSAGESAISAIDSAGSAVSSETSSKASKASADASAISQAEALNSQNAAKTSETNSKASETKADESKQATAGSEQAALSSEKKADEHRASSEQSNQSSISAKNQSEDARDQSVTAQKSSESARDLAKQWASNPEDSPVTGDDYSALHWSAVAKRYADSMTNGMYFAGCWDLTDGFPPEPDDSRVPWYRLTESNTELFSECKKGDQLIWDVIKKEWFVIDTSDKVWSVNGKLGDVSLSASDVGARPVSYVPTWSEVTSKPTTFPPSSHSHSWSSVTDKPSTFPPSSHNHDSTYAALSHSHSNYVPTSRTINSKALTGNITLSASDVKARADSWKPAWNDVSSKPSQATRWPTYAEVTSKPTTFPPSSHTHTISNISSLQSSLDGKEPKLDSDRKRKITISTSDPSGGSDGDIWFKVE